MNEHINGTPIRGGAEELAISERVNPKHINGERRQTRNGRFLPPANLRAVAPLASEVRPTRTEWVWRGRIPLGAVTLIDGDPCNGKSALTCDLAARVSRGLSMPDGSPGVSGGVVMVNLEDNHAATIVPRLMAAEADLDRIKLWSCIEGDSEGEQLPTLEPEGLGLLEGLISEVGARLVIVDPLMAVLPSKVNSYRDQDMRRVLAPLAKLAERLNFAAVVVRHFTKATGGPALYRGGGSIGIIGAARSALAVGKDPSDPERRVLAINKANLAPSTTASLGYRLVGVYLEEIADEVPRIEWTGQVEVSADQLVAVPLDPEERGALTEAIDWLRQELAAGPVPSKKLEQSAKAQGISTATLRRARTALGLVRGPGRFQGPWEWRLPDSGPDSLNEPQSCSLTRMSNSGKSCSTLGGDAPAEQADVAAAEPEVLEV